MRRWLKKSAVPKWAIFLAVCILIYRSYQTEIPICQDIRNEESYSRLATKAPIQVRSQSAVKSTIPFHPFEKGYPKLVVILTYQRCGSTFFGQLFNENPNAFYMFEPLDSLYSAIYGTRQGWNALSDITSYRNGSERILPEKELKMVSQFLLSLLTCDVVSLPTETLTNHFFALFSSEALSTNKYAQCVMQIILFSSNCSAYVLSKYCGGRFGETSEEVRIDCHRALTDKNYRSTKQNRFVFAEYLKCRKHLRTQLDEKCSMIWKSTCSDRSLRAVKVVRGTMDSMEPLLRALPNFRVIHLVRDPRAVVVSRKKFSPSVRGVFADLDSNQTLSREALLYCRTVAKDIRRRKELEAIYPGKIFPVIYDDVVRKLKSYIEDVYRFLDVSVPENVWSWYGRSNYPRHYLGRLDSTAIATQWQDLITVRENRKIETVCEEFFQVTNYTWVK